VGGCKHAKSTNLHEKTLKNRKDFTELGGCRLSTGGVYTPPRGGVRISLLFREICWVLSTVAFIAVNRF